MSHAESPNGSPAAAAATEDETEAVTAVEGTEQTAVDSTDQAQPVNEVQKSLAQLLGKIHFKKSNVSKIDICETLFALCLEIFFCIF